MVSDYLKGLIATVGGLFDNPPKQKVRDMYRLNASERDYVRRMYAIMRSNKVTGMDEVGVGFTISHLTAYLNKHFGIDKSHSVYGKIARSTNESYSQDN